MEVADRAEQPPHREATHGRAASAAVRTAGGTGPRQRGERLAGRDLDDSDRVQAERGDRVDRAAFDARRLGSTGRRRGPRLDELPQREVGRFVVDHLGGVRHLGVDQRTGRRRHLVLDPRVAVGGDRIRRLPRLERSRDVEHRRQRHQRRRIDRLATDGPLVGDEQRDRHGVEMGTQLGPGVVLGHDLGQWADREAAGLAVEHGCRPLGRSEQRQSVLGQRRRRPQLATGLAGRRRAPIAEAEHALPVAVGAAVVDHADEAVEVDRVDQCIEASVVGRRAVAVIGRHQTSGHG